MGPPHASQSENLAYLCCFGVLATNGSVTFWISFLRGRNFLPQVTECKRVLKIWITLKFQVLHSICRSWFLGPLMVRYGISVWHTMLLYWLTLCWVQNKSILFWRYLIKLYLYQAYKWCWCEKWICVWCLMERDTHVCYLTIWLFVIIIVMAGSSIFFQLAMNKTSSVMDCFLLGSFNSFSDDKKMKWIAVVKQLRERHTVDEVSEGLGIRGRNL